MRARGQQDAPPPLGIGIEGWPYPHPVHMFAVVNGGQPLRMAYMDVAPTVGANGRTAVLLHGKNFSSDYWSEVIADLAGLGYRVVVPDQIGFNKSSKPDLDYSFDELSANTLALLDRLGVAGPIDLVGHSTGGMLAVRFALLHPERVRRLVLEDPIGLEDYRANIPPQTTATLTDAETEADAGVLPGLHRPLFRRLPDGEAEALRRPAHGHRGVGRL